MSLSHRAGCRGVGREVNVRAPPRAQSGGSDRLHVVRRGAVIQDIGRALGLQPQIDGNGVALTGTDASAIGAKGEPSLVVVCDHPLQRQPVDTDSGTRSGRQQFVHTDPAGGVECETDSFGAVPQDEAQELADPDERLVHREDYHLNPTLRPSARPG